MNGQRRPKRQAGLRQSFAALGLAAALVTTGCSSVTPSQNGAPSGGASTGTSVDSGAAASPGAVEPTHQPSEAEVLAAKVQTSLANLGSNTKAPTRDQMKAAMLDAGAAQPTLELSIDKTPTGLAVDAIEAASRIANQCVIGQVRSGVASVVVLPVLASGRCFVGDQH